MHSVFLSKEQAIDYAIASNEKEICHGAVSWGTNWICTAMAKPAGRRFRSWPHGLVRPI